MLFQENTQVHDLLEIIQFTEQVSSRIHSILDEAEIYKTIQALFRKSKKYTMSILLLDDSKEKLSIRISSIYPRQLIAAEKAIGFKMYEYKIDLRKTNIYSRVIKEGKTIQVNVQNIIDEFLPHSLALLLVKIFKYNKKYAILTPLRENKKIIGAFAMSSTNLAEYFIPSVINLGQHISNALQLAQEYTKYKQLEKTLLNSENRYRELVDLLPQTIFEIDLKGTILFTNRQGLEVFQYTEEDIEKGLNINQLVAPEDILKMHINIQKILNGEKIYDNEYRAVKKDGSTFTVAVFSSLISYDNKPIGLRGIVIDISEKKASTEIIYRLNMGVEQSIDGIAVSDLKYILTYVNQAFAEMHGYTPPELIGKKIMIINNNEQSKELKKRIHQIKTKGSWKGEINHIKKNGSIFPTYMSVTLLKDHNKKPIGIMTICKDITEQVRTREEIAQYNQELHILSSKLIKAYDMERKRISRELHDEMGQLFTAALINLSAIQEMITSKYCPEIKEKIKETISLINKTSEQIHELSIELRPSMLDDLGLVPTLNWYLKKWSERLNINTKFEADEIEKRFSPDIEISIYRIIQEALNNIAKYAKALNVTIRLKQQNSKIKILIKDDGKGFNMEELHVGNMNQHGIGLLGIRERIRLLNGSFNIQSIPKKGTKLYITIPWEYEP